MWRQSGFVVVRNDGADQVGKIGLNQINFGLDDRKPLRHVYMGFLPRKPLPGLSHLFTTVPSQTNATSRRGPARTLDRGLRIRDHVF